MNESSDQLARSSAAAPPLTGGPLDEALREIHQARAHFGSAVTRLVPYPLGLPFTDDARVTALTVTATADGRVAVMIRYCTEYELEAVALMYAEAFTAAGVSLEDPLTPTARLAIVRGEDQQHESSDNTASCRVTIDDHDAMRHVRATIDYDDFDATRLFAKYANWHHGAAPIDTTDDTATHIDSFEIKTIDNTPRLSFSTLYTTRFRLPNTTVSRVRLPVEHRLSEAGWTWLEATMNVLYLSGPFDAETHMSQAGDDVLLDFVGEFGPFPNRQIKIRRPAPLRET